MGGHGVGRDRNRLKKKTLHPPFTLALDWIHTVLVISTLIRFVRLNVVLAKRARAHLYFSPFILHLSDLHWFLLWGLFIDKLNPFCCCCCCDLFRISYILFFSFCHIYRYYCCCCCCSEFHPHCKQNGHSMYIKSHHVFGVVV